MTFSAHIEMFLHAILSDFTVFISGDEKFNLIFVFGYGFSLHLVKKPLIHGFSKFIGLLCTLLDVLVTNLIFISFWYHQFHTNELI